MDYKKYSLENLENWLHDVLSCEETSPHEIYSVIRKVVKDEYDFHKEKSQQCFGLLELLSGHRPVKLECDKDDSSPECKGAWNDFWEEVDEDRSREYNLREAEYYNKRAELDVKHSKYYYDYTRNDLNRENPFNKKKWVLPVEQVHDDYYVSFPDDLLKAAKLREGDEVNWVDNGDGSFSIRKVNKFVRGECYDDFENPCDMVESQDEKEELDAEYEAIRDVGGYDWTPKK